jgi:TRAP-type C4-dicarboxylate transport system permease small subunit
MAGGRHIRIEYFLDLMPPRARRGAEILGLLLVLLCFGLLARYGASLAWDEYRFEVTSSGLGHPNWWYTIWLPVLSLVVMARALGRLIRLARGQEG